MDSEIMVETLPLLGTCTLCLCEGTVKSMFITHKYKGDDELYSEMLLKCFSIDVNELQLGDAKRQICDLCTCRLRDAVDFRHQVEESIKTLEIKYTYHEDVKAESGIDASKRIAKHVPPDIAFVGDDIDDDYNDFEDDSNTEIQYAYLENVKAESELDASLRISTDIPRDTSFVDNDGDAYPDHNDDAHNHVKSETKNIESSQRRLRKRLSRKTLSRCKLVKKSDFTETDAMIQSGLFPFKMHHNKKFSCRICLMKTSNFEYLRTHVPEHCKKSIHLAFLNMKCSRSQQFFKANTKLRCRGCTEDMACYEDLVQHLGNCTRIKYTNKSLKINNLPFKLEKGQVDCPICKKVFLNFVNLNTHMNTHYPNYICENCGKAFASPARLRGHIRTHEIGEFPCKYCDAVFDRITKRENHVSKEHKAGVRYACKRCNIQLPSFYARQKHLAEVHNEELKRYKCKACPQSYITPGHLSSHVRRDHLNERNHKCDKCDLAFYTRNALKMHMIKHDGERIHSCDICQKSYQRKKTLKEHMRIHNNDKRFICPICGRAFTQKCTLKGHLKVHDRKSDVDISIVTSV